MKTLIKDNPLKLSAAMLAITLLLLFTTLVFAQSISSLKFEAESGTALSGASVVGDSTASGGNHLAFGSTPPSSNSFFEDFTNDTDLSGFNSGVYHRDPHLVDMTQWPGDHESHAAGDCGGPTTSRTVHRNAPSESVFLCQSVDGDKAKAHVMTSIGDTSGYSIGWFSPKQIFSSVNSVKFNVNLTDLGARQWWKVGVVTDALYKSTYANDYGSQIVSGFLVSDVGSASLRTSLATSDLLIATWSGQGSAGWNLPQNGGGGYLKIGNTNTTAQANPSPTDKATRHPVSLVDNKNGTITFTVAGVSVTRSGSFPPCPCRVVWYDHNYTPNKSEGGLPIGYTWHWDNIQVN